MRHTATLTSHGGLSLGLLVALVILLVVVATQWPTFTGPVAQAPGVASKTSAAHPHHHEHRSPGKPGADITLVGAGVQTLPLGNPRDLKLTLASHLPPGAVRIQLESSPQLELLGSERQWQFEVNGQQTLQLPVTVHANGEGLHYVHLFIEHQDAHGNTTARALAAAFRVGHALPNLYEKNISTATRSEYNTLPAREVIY